MINTLPQIKIIDFDRFIEWYLITSAQKYELHGGIIVTMPKPKGKHSQIAGFLMNELGFEIKKLGLTDKSPETLKNCRLGARSKTQLTHQHPSDVGLSPDGEATPTFFNLT
jgi:Uma2 family endonuclease